MYNDVVQRIRNSFEVCRRTECIAQMLINIYKILRLMENFLAKVATNKSLLKEYETNVGRTVYLNDGDEFQIQLFNPKTTPIACRISINGEQFSNDFVLEPGQRIWLERYLDVARKFKFKTYMVDDTAEGDKAIANNGVIEISFFEKKQRNNYISTAIFNTPITTDRYNSSELLASSICDLSVHSDTLCCATNSISAPSPDLKVTFGEISSTFDIPQQETGKITEGSYSSQSFNECYYEFNLGSFKTEKITILPMSKKPYTANDLEKIYCVECGRRLNTKYKFCPYCGNKVE